MPADHSLLLVFIFLILNINILKIVPQMHDFPESVTVWAYSWYSEIYVELNEWMNIFEIPNHGGELIKKCKKKTTKKTKKPINTTHSI